MVHISLSPNLEMDDVAVAIRRLISFWSWKEHKSEKKFGELLSYYFENENIYLLNSGRSALFVALKNLKLKNEDEIIIQSFTCNAVANPIIWSGAKPVYSDIDKTFNIDASKLEKKITPNTRAIIVQHTFGIPAKIDEIIAIADKYNILVIEDCAHALGATYKNKKLGTWGDIAFFSFGRDKVISSVYGGALLVNNKKFLDGIKDEMLHLIYPSSSWTLRQLVHPLITYISLRTYNFGGKYLLYIFQRIGVLSYAVTQEERVGKKPKYFAKKLPDTLANLALNQFLKLERLNEHRKALAKIYEDNLKSNPNVKIIQDYDSGSIFLRYPIMHAEPKKIIESAKREDIILGDWYKEIIAPAGTDMGIMSYRVGSCQIAEGVASNIVNLPTNIKTTKVDARKIVDIINNFHTYR